MKKTIIFILILMLGGCATIERLMLADAKKPEKNVLSEPVSGVTITELDFTKQFPALTEVSKASLGAFFADGNLLYFAYSEYPNTAHASISIARSIYTLDLTTKVFKKILTFDPKKEFHIASIAVLKGKVYFSGGYPFTSAAGECNYEVAVLNGTKIKVLLSETTDGLYSIPKLFKFDSALLVFLQRHFKKLSDTEDVSSFKIASIRSDLKVEYSTEYKGTNNSAVTNVGYPMMDTISIDGKTFAYAVYKNSVASIYSGKYDAATGTFKDALPIKIGENVSPQDMLGFKNHWYVSSVKNTNMQHILDVFDQSTGKRVAMQIFDGPTSASGLAYFDNNRALFFGNFENDGTHSKPLGTGRLFLTNVVGNTIKYQRIDKLIFNSWPFNFTKLADKKYLVEGRLDRSNPVRSYMILEIK